jgi:hypothetical protein
MNTNKQVTLADLLDRILDKGVVISGDIFISVAGIDLAYIDLKVLIGSLDAIEKLRNRPVQLSKPS